MKREARVGRGFRKLERPIETRQRLLRTMILAESVTEERQEINLTPDVVQQARFDDSLGHHFAGLRNLAINER